MSALAIYKNDEAIDTVLREYENATNEAATAAVWQAFDNLPYLTYQYVRRPQYPRVWAVKNGVPTRKVLSHKQATLHKCGIVVGYIQADTGVPFVGWSMCRHDDKFIRDRAIWYALARAKPIHEYIGVDQAYLCTKTMRAAAPVVAKMIARMVQTWSEVIDSCEEASGD